MPNAKTWGLKIRGKIALGYVVILLMLGLFLIVVSGRITDLEEETRFLSTHDIQVHELSYVLEKNVLDMETGQRGYALTGLNDYLEPYTSGLVEWKLNYSKLSELIRDNPEQLQNLNNIRDSIESWINEAGQPVIELKRSGQNAAVAAYFHNDQGKPILDLVRSQSEYFRGIERDLTEARIGSLERSNNRLLITMYILWSMVAVLAAIITYLIASSIVKPLRNVINVINGIASGGSMAERITVRTMDEIYELAECTNGLLESVQRQQWQSEQLAQMSMALQETQDLASLCRTFVNKLAVMLEIQYAAIYVADKDGRYNRIYSYAGSELYEVKVGLEGFMPGEGVIGQCILDKSIKRLEDLPADYISINSGLGRTAPRSAVAAPLVFENIALAAVEAASITRWSPYHMELFTKLLELMAIALHTTLNRIEIHQLYGESQVMNEELQVQSEELQVQAEELQGHTKELLELNSELDERRESAEKVAQELEQYNVELERSSRYKTEFLANMSHELRTPLNSMLILSQLLAENRNGNLNEEEQEYATVIHNSGSDLLAMINDILDLSKVEAGKMLVEMDAVNLTELPAMLKSYFGKTAEQRKLHFAVRIGEGVPDLFFTDEMRLHQILRNLLSNAFKFTEKGEVEVDISYLSSYGDGEYRSSGPVLAFAVKDTGIGISESSRKLIFEAFRQADGSTARKFGGTGLGLSISLQLARLLDGHIALESREGTGSTFTLYLPCRTSEESEASPGSEALQAQAAASSEDGRTGPEKGRQADLSAHEKDRARLQGRTVLIVDDDSRNIFAIQQGLEPYGMNILTAQTGFECLQIVREQPDVDIVLLDIMMPNLDGYDTLSIIREELLLPDLPIIAISAKTMKEEREKCLAAGANDFLSKPVAIREVVTRMGRLLSST
ncbi:CHASE3 domain-containing protein [Paenibacillus tengchongensis]|uniref:CHASE3 domain-containing protein n=1 Tax=Paenibacillus tengchongensis TaxID=2608684 RepID=UPI00124CCF8F|nr:CHASE3 domain-containing protein [Paenibacillus tengchongensis]